MVDKANEYRAQAKEINAHREQLEKLRAEARARRQGIA
jgi:hypothetical protein